MVDVVASEGSEDSFGDMGDTAVLAHPDMDGAGFVSQNSKRAASAKGSGVDDEFGYEVFLGGNETIDFRYDFVLMFGPEFLGLGKIWFHYVGGFKEVGHVVNKVLGGGKESFGPLREVGGAGPKAGDGQVWQVGEDDGGFAGEIRKDREAVGAIKAGGGLFGGV